jgi:hypothetical protein
VVAARVDALAPAVEDPVAGDDDLGADALHAGADV